jgi:hypothetical protein
VLTRNEVLGEDFERLFLPRFSGQDLGAVDVFERGRQRRVTGAQPNLVEVNSRVDGEGAERVLQRMNV